MSVLLALLIALTSGVVTFDTASPGWRSISATTSYKPDMEVICVERWGDRCKHMKVLTGGARIWEQEHEADFEHELAHVLDFMDDGFANGSPGHPWTLAKQQEFYSEDSLYTRVCTSNLSEWYACETVRTGGLS